MKKLSIVLALLFATLSGEAQTNPMIAYAVNCGIPSVNGAYTNFAPGNWGNAAGTWYLGHYPDTNIWWLQSGDFNNGYISYQSISSNLFGVWTNGPAAFYYPGSFPSFGTNPPSVTTVPLLTQTVSGFWPSNGGVVKFAASGITTSSNVLCVLLNSNLVFASNPTQTNGSLWRLTGALNLDPSSNLTTIVKMTGSGMNSAGVFSQTNFIGTNLTFTLALDSTRDTNLTISTLEIYGQQAVNGVQPYYAWPPAAIGQQIVWQATTPTLPDLGNQKGGLVWCSNGFFFVTGSTNGTTIYTKSLAP